MQHAMKDPPEPAAERMHGVWALLAAIAATASTMASAILWAAAGGGGATLVAAVAAPWILAAVAWGGTSLHRRAPVPRTSRAAGARHVSTLAGANE